MATSEYFTPNSGGTKWASRGDSETKSLGKGDHAEVRLYKSLVTKDHTVVLLVQDAFPCKDKCVTYFKNQTKGGTQSIVIQVEADQGSYLAEHVPPLTKPTAYPCLLYFHGGNMSYNVAPVGWPASPALPK